MTAPVATTNLEAADAERARALFVAARKLLDEGEVERACEQFARSEEAVSTIATQLNLGLCHRMLGHLVVAHAFYRRAQLAATTERDTARATTAGAEATSIEAQLSTITLLVVDRADDSLAVSLDGAQQPSARWGSPQFVEPGKHEVRVSAADAEPWRDSFTLVAGQSRMVTVPALRHKPRLEASVRPEHSVPRPVEEHDDHGGGLGAQRVAAIALAGTTVIGLGLATTFGVLALDASHASDAYCSRSDVCTSRGLELRRQAAAHATRADASALGAALSIAGAAVLWFTAPAAEQRAAVGVGYQSGGPHLQLALRL